jgi:iron complex outermembrane receptor protein
MRRLLFLLFLAMSVLRVVAQTTDTLQGVEVSDKRNEDIKDSYSSGTKQIGIDSRTLRIYQHQSLADLLAATSTTFIKSTGLGTFSTLSLRGASAAQSAVYWEGVPLMNGATGLTDISLLPVGLFGDITMNYGSSAALWGSGNVGGALMLQDARPVFNDTSILSGRLGGGIASFGRYSLAGKLVTSGKRIFASISVAGASAQNDFTAADEQGNLFNTENARQSSYNVAAAIAYRLSDRDLLTLRGQYYNYDREIPRALFESYSIKDQHDEGQRLLLHWQRAEGKIFRQIYAKGALLNNSFDYRDSSIGLSSGLQTQQLFFEGGLERKFTGGGQLLLFIPMQYFWLTGGPHHATQYRAALAGTYAQNFFKDRLHSALNLRMESFDGKLIALPGLNVAYLLSKELSARANAQYTYRAPTLNELYYEPGGNSGLNPERGWSVDAGIDLTRSSGSHFLHRHSLSIYNRSIQDWIIWLGGAMWTPHNLAAVHSRGVESENSVEYRNAKFFCRLGLNAAFTRSTVTESYLTGDNSVGKQLPYVPSFVGTGIASLGWRALYFQWSTVYTGKRFTVSDESQSLTAYYISNVNVSYNFYLGGNACYLQCSLNNLFNESYAVVAFRPMPGLGWSISGGINLRKSR